MNQRVVSGWMVQQVGTEKIQGLSESRDRVKEIPLKRNCQPRPEKKGGRWIENSNAETDLNNIETKTQKDSLTNLQTQGGK